MLTPSEADINAIKQIHQQWIAGTCQECHKNGDFTKLMGIKFWYRLETPKGSVVPDYVGVSLVEQPNLIRRACG